MMSRLPSASEIWKALDHAADSNPPVYYLVNRLARQLVPDDHLGYRLPSILGLLGIVYCIYIILSRRVSRLSALVGATFVLCTPLAEYAYEARPYALMIGCVSCAILAWQRIEDSSLYAIFVAISLAAAVSLHYYAVFVWPAFLVAEASVWIFHRRFRVSAWASIAAGALPLLFFSKLLLRMRQYYGHNFWSHVSFRQIVFMHNWLFNMSGYWGWSFAVGITAIILYYSVVKAATPGLPGNQKVEEEAFPIEERALILMLLWLPAIAIAASKIGHGGMTERYMMPTILGGALAFGYLTSKLPRTVGVLLLFLLSTSYALSSVGVVKNALNGSLLESRVAATHELQAIVAENNKSGLPVVMSNEVRYLPMVYYTPAASKLQLYAVTDPSAAVEFADNKSDSADLELLVLRQYFPLQVEDYGGFVSKHREFLVVSGTGGGYGGGSEWLPARLAHDGDDVRLLSTADQTTLYHVIMKP
jgi:hypothetical protein